MRLGLSGYDFQAVGTERLEAVARGSGVRWVELWPGNASPASLSEEDGGFGSLQVACVSAGTRARLLEAEDPAEALAEIDHAIARAQRFGAPFALIYPGVSLLSPEVAGRRIGTALETRLRAAEAHGITLVVENLFDVWGVDPDRVDPFRAADDIRRLVEAIDSPAFGIAFDPCNFVIAGLPAFPDAYTILQPHIRYVQFKDVVPLGAMAEGTGAGKILADHAGGRFEAVPAGRGIVDLGSIVRRLEADRYDGFVTLEPFAHPAALEGACAESLSYLASIGVTWRDGPGRK